MVLGCYSFATLYCVVICGLAAFNNLLEWFHLLSCFASFFTGLCRSCPVCCDIIVHVIEHRPSGLNMLRQDLTHQTTTNSTEVMCALRWKYLLGMLTLKTSTYWKLLCMSAVWDLLALSCRYRIYGEQNVKRGTKMREREVSEKKRGT